MEIFDPEGSLESAPQVTQVPLEELSPALEGVVAAWSFDPSQIIKAPVLVRLPLPEGVEDGDELLVLTDSLEFPLWRTQALAVAEEGTMRMRLSSFSTKAFVSQDTARLSTTADVMAAFEAGLDCETGTISAPEDPPLEYAVSEPNVKETKQSGPIQHKLIYEQATCVLADIIGLEGRLFFSDRYPDKATGVLPRWEDRYVHPNVVEPLLRVIDLVAEHTCDRVKLVVASAYQAGGHAPASLHWEGRGIDLQLVNPGLTMHRKSGEMRRLGHLARMAGFDWVVVHRGETSDGAQGGIHVHASMKGSVDMSNACCNGTSAPGCAWLCVTNVLGCQCVEAEDSSTDVPGSSSACSTEYTCCRASMTGTMRSTPAPRRRCLAFSFDPYFSRCSRDGAAPEPKGAGWAFRGRNRPRNVPKRSLKMDDSGQRWPSRTLTETAEALLEAETESAPPGPSCLGSSFLCFANFRPILCWVSRPGNITALCH